MGRICVAGAKPTVWRSSWSRLIREIGIRRLLAYALCEGTIEADWERQDRR